MKYGARLDEGLSCSVREKLIPEVEVDHETIQSLHGRSSASLVRAVREVRLKERTPISDQGSIGSCYANAWCDAMELLQPAGSTVQLSRLMAYFNSRLLHGDECSDSGTFGATMRSSCQRIGVCTEAAWPYDGREPERNERVFKRPELSNYEEAYDHRVESSYWIRSTKTSERVRLVKEHIDLGFPVVAAFSIGQNWDDPPKEAVLSPVSRIEGGHAVVLDGYVEQSDGSVLFDVRNSWGESWGRDGHIYIASSFLDVTYCDRLDVIVLSPHFGGR